MRVISANDLRVGMLVRRQWGQDDVVYTASGRISHVLEATVYFEGGPEMARHIGTWCLLARTHEERVADWRAWFASNGATEGDVEWVTAQARALIEWGMDAPQVLTSEDVL